VPTLTIDIVSETAPPELNGVAMTVGRLVDGMRARGHRVTVVRPRPDAAKAAGVDFTVRGLPLPGYPEVRFGLPAGARLRRRWRTQRPDVVHVVTEGPLGWSAVRAACALGIPVTSGFHTNFDRYSTHYGLGWLRPLISAYLRGLHRRTAATLVPTAALAAELAGEGVPGVRVVGRGVDTALFDPALRSAVLRRSWGAGDADLVCLYAGRLAPEKNLDLVARGFEAVRAGSPTARLVWVGDGPSRARLAAAPLPQHFAGWRRGADLAAHYASADLFLFPSLTETYGNVVSEAMASGLPVVAYRSAAAAELIVDGVNGVSVPAGDDRAYVAAVRQLGAASAGWRRRVGDAARDSMLARSWDAVVAAFERALCEAVAR
jgi:glycosyltransferase involved in cell wall biosynthesis